LELELGPHLALMRSTPVTSVLNGKGGALVQKHGYFCTGRDDWNLVQRRVGSTLPDGNQSMLRHIGFSRQGLG